MREDWRAAFPRGCRVRLDLAALEAWRQRWQRRWRVRIKPPYTGYVTGYARANDDPQLYVLLDGRSVYSITTYPASCVSRLTDAEGGPGA